MMHPKKMALGFVFLVSCLSSSACIPELTTLNPQRPDGVAIESASGSTPLSSSLPTEATLFPGPALSNGRDSPSQSPREITLNSHLPYLPFPWEEGTSSTAVAEDLRHEPRESFLDTFSAPSSPCQAMAAAPVCPPVWGIVEMRGYMFGDHVASNGVEFHPLFSINFDFNVWLWRRQGLYLFSESNFWGQKAELGVTNPSQGVFDFSKREFDFNAGFAWNYAGSWEARAFAYSYNNLNRGWSEVSPGGFNDGIGLENRYYLSSIYQELGTPAFDQARASFISIGYYPTKSMINAAGHVFDPGAFARAYLTWEIWKSKCYLFGDFDFIASNSFTPTLFNLNAGVALRPFEAVPRLEFRIGTEDTIDLHGHEREWNGYFSVSYIF
jgi:hypothetical protein